jgi:hypothetical protein
MHQQYDRDYKMAKIQESKKLPGKSADDVYQAVLQAAPLAGLEVWKRRDIAWLAMIKHEAAGAGIDGSVSVRPGADLTISLSSDDLAETDLRSRAETIFGEVVRILG